jgi:hypothetical protein
MNNRGDSTDVKSSPPPVEFERPQAISRRFGISERTLHEWIDGQAVESYAVTSPGKKRSKLRLVNIESVRRFIARRAQGAGEAGAIVAPGGEVRP